MGFSNIHSVAKHQKIESEIVNIFVAVEVGPLEKKQIFEKKSRSAEKIERGDPLVSPGMVCYAVFRSAFLIDYTPSSPNKQ